MLFTKADGILDLRSLEDYKAGHLNNSTWLSINDLPESLNALPAAPASLYLVGDKDQIEAASLLLDSKSYQVTGSLVIESQKAMQQWANKLPGLVENGSQSKTLWSPSLLVKEFVDLIHNQSLTFGEVDKVGKVVYRPSVLDIGCGGGRDAIFLAKNRMNVIAIDHEAKVLKRAKALSSLSGTSVKFKCCDIKKQGCLPEQQFDLITVVRFLNRDMYDYIKKATRPGGFVLFQTFVEGVEQFSSPKNPNFILGKTELAEVFAGFNIIIDRIDKLNDGRPVLSFIAQKACSQ
ncbi:methyltransferase domain-containing protein [Thiomicrorhabdus sp. Milos-T2]|uniref:methyltransferase domain-containing protein n=1 Tax=Thiomicrorhabdus sp. Milos-T2 TaxID=90814 RepID=UPI00057161CF|nr:methyltransferase domain-containing protein [Thiomicrorhabdus sp. Milos-T2]